MLVRELLEYEQALFTNEIEHIDHMSHKLHGRRLNIVLYRIPTTSRHMRTRYRVAASYGKHIFISKEVNTWFSKSGMSG
jgi:hypothetical protein